MKCPLVWVKLQNTSTLLISYLDSDAMLSSITKREGDKQSKTPSHSLRGVHGWHKGCSFKKKLIHTLTK